jgi:regulatory protein
MAGAVVHGRRRHRSAPRERQPLGATQALEAATRFLGVRPRSQWEVERRLRRGGADDQVIEITVERLSELGLIDDLAFAQWWLEQRDRHAPRGHRLVEAELRQHGVGRDVIERLREEMAAEEDVGPTEDARARAALDAHLRGRDVPTDPKALQRLGMFLVRRGFAPDVARATIRSAAAEPIADNDG